MPEDPKLGYYATHDAARVEEYSLLVQAKSVDAVLANDAKVKIINRNIDFVRKEVWSWLKGNTDVDFDETIHHAKVCLLDAINNYELSSGVSFRTYAAYHLKNLRSKIFKKSKEIPTELDDRDCGYVFLPNPDFKNFNLRTSLENAIDAVLTLTEQQVVKACYFDGKTQRTVSAERGISESRVSTIIKLALPKLRAYLQARGIKPGFLELN